MATRAMVLRRNGASYECYYRHCDGYPTGLGAQLIEALRSPFCKTWQDIVKQCELQPENKVVRKPEDAFLKLQGDLEYIYVVSENPASLTIYRTTNPRSLPAFAFKIWSSYAKYFPAPHDVMKTMAEIQLIAHITLQALENYHCNGGFSEWQKIGREENSGRKCVR